MKIGMLWLDLSSKPLPDRISEAAAYYRDKYGRDPDTCFINPKDPGQPCSLAGFEIKTDKSIMPGHLWLGIAAREV